MRPPDPRRKARLLAAVDDGVQKRGLPDAGFPDNHDQCRLTGIPHTLENARRAFEFVSTSA
jgi:hypothetical protein